MKVYITFFLLILLIINSLEQYYIIKNLTSECDLDYKINTCLSGVLQSQEQKSKALIAINNYDEEKIQILNFINVPIIITHINKLGTLLTMSERKFDFLLKCQDVERLNQTLSVLKTWEFFNSRARYIVLAENRRYLDNIATILWHYRLYRSVVMIKSNSSGIDKVDLFLINLASSNCGKNITAIYTNSYFLNNLSLAYPGSQLFNPMMARHFQNCPLNVIYLEYMPWVNANRTGIHSRFMELVERATRFSFQYAPVKDIAGFYQPQMKPFRVIYKEFDEGADIFSPSYGQLEEPNVEVSTQIFETSFFFAAPKSAHIPVWKAIVRFYSPYYFICIGIFLLVIYVVFCAIVHLSNSHFDGKLLYVFGIVFLGFSSGRRPPTKAALKFIVLVGSLATIITLAVLNGFLYEVLHNPMYEKPITDYDSLLQSDLPIVLFHGVSKLFNSTEPKIYQIIFNRCIDSKDLIPANTKLLMTYKNFTTVIDTGTAIMEPHMNEMLTTFKIHTFHTFIYMKKHHELFEVIDLWIHRVLEGGFSCKLISDASWKYYLLNRRNSSEAKPQVSSLSMEHLEAAFLSLEIGLILATAVFVMELLYFCARKMLHR